LRAYSDLPIFISATNVQTGRVRVFPREKITADAVMASACLPLLFRAVEIDGVPYWDVGYLGNPVIFPFFRATRTEPVFPGHQDRGSTGGADQSVGARANADLGRRDHEAHQRDHLQLLAHRRIPRH
jgi:predicted acylesterase/phospholipase RssA